MPSFNHMQTTQIPGNGNFQFSAIRPDKLGATEYTLVTIAVDISSSVANFSNELLAGLKAVIGACRHSPRAQNIMVRMLEFNADRFEKHGFVPLNQIDPNQYKALRCNGSTALYDATYDAITATNSYAQTLSDQDFDVNAAIYIITDGMDNASVMQATDVGREIRKALKAEFMDSLVTVLIGVDTRDASISAYLQMFKNDAGLSQYVDMNAASAANLAKLGAFVSQSISLQSRALGSGQAAQSLTF